MSTGARLYTAIYRSFIGTVEARPWLVAALVIGSLPYLQALIATLSGPFTIDDDARQLVFWMVRWGDPALFRDDLIADYFASVSPPGFRAAYWLPAQLGIDPVLMSKLYPIALNALMTLYAFRLALLLGGGRVPAAFLGAVGLAFAMAWSHVIISATPRAFGVPLLMVFYYYMARRHIVGVTISGALVALTYPPGAALGLAALGLTLVRRPGRRWRHGIGLDFSRATVLPIVCAGSLCVTVLLVAAIDRDFGPIATMEQIRNAPMFRQGGRIPILDAQGDFRISACNGLIGLLPPEWCKVVGRRPAGLGLLTLSLAGLFWLARGVPARGAPGERPVDWDDIARIIFVGLVLYGIAFMFMLKMHMPSRYTTNSLRLVAPLAAIMLGVLLAERGLRAAGTSDGRSLTSRQRAWLGTAVLTVAAFIGLYPLDVSRNNISPRYPGILAYLGGQPKSSLIAGMHGMTSNLPSFARRSVLAASEYAIPHDLGYITRYRARADALIDSQYAADPAALAAFLSRYRVTHLVLDPAELTTGGLKRVWWRREHDRAHARATAGLARGVTPALRRLIEPCTAFKEKTLVVIAVRCVLERANGGR